MKAWLVLGGAALWLTGCLVDIYGGDPRLQIKNSSLFYIRSTGIGNPDNPTFFHELDPVLRPEKNSEVIELPAAGDLHFWVRVSDSAKSWDTVLQCVRSVDIGQFQIIEVLGEQRGALSTSP